MTIREMAEMLTRPEIGFRSLPFWGWNDKLEPDELKRQLTDMREKGIGGCFVHSREGLETEYLSSEWMDAVCLTVRESKRLGIEAWVYDEDKWPSGSAGGLVSSLDPACFTAKGLTLEFGEWTDAEPKLSQGERVIGVYRAERMGSRKVRLGTGDRRVVLRRELSGCSEWYNGTAPTDCLNRDAVSAFIEVTHERYRRALGGTLKGKIQGFFTDEPNFFDFFAVFTPGRPWLPWTDDLADEFYQRRGYRPEPLLPFLFFEGEGSAKIRHDYWRTITELFSERFMRRIYDWCEENGIRSTGHMLYENDMGYGIRVCGAAMPHYRWLHAPGIDLLGEQTKEYLTVKQCSSVAHQFGRKMTISETYGCSGWELGFEGQKWVGDWQLVNGITRRCMHLMLYSITGCRKRDYPPVFNYQNTWWEYDRYMEDYFARMGLCASAGEVVRDVLVLHPISSMWTRCGSSPDEDLSDIEMNMGWKQPQFTDLNEQGEEYNRFAEMLVRSHLDFDFGDEIILSEVGSVNGGFLSVGEARYSVVVVPEVCSLFKSTIDLLRHFLAAGGYVIWVGQPPEMVEGVRSDLGSSLYRMNGVERADCYEAVPALLRALLPNTLRITARTGGENSSVLSMLRRTEDGLVLVAVNNDREQATTMRVTLPENGSVRAYDAWTDTRTPMRIVSDGMKTEFIDTLQPAGSRVYLLSRDTERRTDQLLYPYRHPHYTDPVFATIGPEAYFERTAPNALVLDRCRYALGNEELSEEAELWQQQRRMRKRLGWQQVYYNGAPQRYTWLEKARSLPGCSFRLSFTIFVREDLPDGSCRLAVEKPDGLHVRCNDIDCERSEGWFMDRGIGLFSLKGLRKGENVIDLSGSYTAERELEDVYVIGDFAVNGRRELVREPSMLHFGDWCLQGYPHYAGSMLYRFSVPGFDGNGRIILHMGRDESTLCEILVNGRSAGLCFGRCATQLDITELLHADGNELTIKAVGSPRNLFGPLHQAYDGCSRISWADFRTEGFLSCESYTLKPYGLMGQIALYREV